MTLLISGNTPSSYVARLEEIVKDVRAGNVKPDQLEGLIRPLQLSGRQVDAFWSSENATLRDREAAAYAAIAVVMPNAAVFTYGSEQAALGNAGLLPPALTACYFAAATPFNNALATGDVETAIRFAFALISDYGHTPAANAAANWLVGKIEVALQNDANRDIAVRNM